jgi:HTH-type transcriptional regulator / antitoxin HigA
MKLNPTHFKTPPHPTQNPIQPFTKLHPPIHKTPRPLTAKPNPAMSPLPYTVIKYKQQYESYQSVHDYLSSLKKKSRDDRDTVELLGLLIEKWEENQAKKLPETNPVALLTHLMEKNNLTQSGLAAELGVSKSLVSDILNFRRGVSRNLARRLAKRFRVPEELFNKPYKLKG